MEHQSSYRVLLAEDNLFNQKVAITMLKKLGFHEVDIASNGQEVLDRLAINHYPLILMDCEMPVIDGYEATRQIRRNEATREQHSIIVAMTAHALPEDRARCIASGMDDYITKPFKLDTLQEVLARWKFIS
jgi:CheY-like chemotaxis protein